MSSGGLGFRVELWLLWVLAFGGCGVYFGVVRCIEKNMPGGSPAAVYHSCLTIDFKAYYFS